MRVAAIGLALNVVLLPLRAPAQSASTEIESIAVVRHEPFSPFSRVAYEIKPRGRSGVLAFTRRSVVVSREQTTVDLVDGDELATLRDAAAAVCPIGTEGVVVPEPVGERGWTAVTVVHADGTQGVAFAWDDAADTQIDACFELLRTTILGRVEVGTWRNPFWSEGEFGTFRTSATEVARVFIDGIDIGEVTPVNDLPLAPGEHHVRWVSLDGLRAKETVVRITAGTISRIDVELDPIE